METLFWLIVFVFFFIYAPFKWWQKSAEKEDTQSLLDKVKHDLALTEHVNGEIRSENLNKINDLERQLATEKYLSQHYLERWRVESDKIYEIETLVESSKTKLAESIRSVIYTESE